MKKRHITIVNGRENNLKNVTVSIEKGKFTAVTGVSGSGKSSLVNSTLGKESQRIYFSTFPSWSRKYFGVMSKPDADSITGLDAVVIVDQKTGVSGKNSTAGTFSGVYDMLRLLFARFGAFPDELRNYPGLFNRSGTLSRSLFSFNSETGACPTCKGVGVTDYLDPELVIADRTKSIRERALKITAPNGYIIYSQVTLDVLDNVCKAHGFSVDTPLNELSKEQLAVLFYGSDKIVVPFGKHTLESRMKWTGITVKPREEGYYTGFINVMNDILKRDRNANILRFVRSVKCSACNGTRLRPEALKVLYRGHRIVDLADMTFKELHSLISKLRDLRSGELELTAEILKMTDSLIQAGVGSITVSQDASALSGGEIQRIRLAAIAQSRMQGMTFIFDEPAAGLHRSEKNAVTNLLLGLRNRGNTVISVEHDMDCVLKADNIIETGPAGGAGGGHILFSGSIEDFLKKGGALNSPTFKAINNGYTPAPAVKSQNPLFEIEGFIFFKNTINTLTGRSGSGKKTLIDKVVKYLEENGVPFIKTDHSPIGRTPRSNPATYTGISDRIRDIFAKLERSAELGLTKSHFSFNSEAGRCQECEGAGVIETGMKYFGEVQTVCAACGGKRFNSTVLEVKYREKTISGILDMEISQASVFFENVPAVKKTLNIMADLGLGYLKLGQPTSSLSGGEAARIKLATYLSSVKKQSVIILEEPASGLHPQDVSDLLKQLNSIVRKNTTIIAIENNVSFVSSSGNVIETGNTGDDADGKEIFPQKQSSQIILKDVTTHNLKNVSLSIEPGSFTVITGISGSGKTSLAFDTLFSECLDSYLEGYSPFIRSLFRNGSDRNCAESSGLMAPVGISGKFTGTGSRSTAGTVSGIYEILRMLYSRAGIMPDGSKCPFSAGDFSFNNISGACPECAGTGYSLSADIEKLITDRSRSFLEGALDGTKQGKFYGDRDGQFVHTLIAAGRELCIDFSRPVSELSEKELNIALYGIEDREFSVSWHYARGNVTGTHEFKGKWRGFANLLTDEYHRSIGNKNEQTLKELMKKNECPECHGKRLKKEVLLVKVLGRSIDDICAVPAAELHTVFSATGEDKGVFDILLPELFTLTERMTALGLGHISMDRPAASLSLGERERLKLVKACTGELSNILYVIDEPSRGLHTSDCDNIIRIIKDITAAGNTVVAVEHEPSIIGMADTVIEMGPGAGINGGEIIFKGSIDELKRTQTPTAFALNFKITPKNTLTDRFMTFYGAFARNLKNIDVSIPLGYITAVTGVSGSGKTALIKDVLFRTIKEKKAVNCRNVQGLPEDTGVCMIEAVPHKISGRSTVSTVTGISQLLKKKFPKSFSSKSICLKCKGSGIETILMDFLADSVSPCNDCEGTGFTAEALEHLYKGHNIATILAMSVSEASVFFEYDRNIRRILDILLQCGLGHITLNRRTSSLSTGEMHRIDLAVELSKGSENRNTVFIFDEPSTGLHHSDIISILDLFEFLKKAGHTVIIAEHRIQMISSADHVIDLGPGCGELGGNLLFSGSVKELIGNAASKTAEALRKILPEPLKKD